MFAWTVSLKLAVTLFQKEIKPPNAFFSTWNSYTLIPSPFSPFFFFYLFLNFYFLVVSAAGRRRGCSRETRELGWVAAFFIKTGWWTTERIVLFEVSLDNKHMLAFIADVTPFKLQNFHQTGTYDSSSNRQKVTHIPGFRNVLSSQLWANRQTC